MIELAADPNTNRAGLGREAMNNCKNCRWWRVSVGETQPQSFGQCMYDPPSVFLHYDDETDSASMYYERPQTYEDDYCSRFASK